VSKKLLTLLAATIALALAAVALGACGDDDEGDTSVAETTTSEETTAEDTTVAVEAVPDGSFAFTETELTAAPGADTIEFYNPSSTRHNVYIEDESGEVVAETETVTEARAEAFPEPLEAGTYTYYCDIPGHREGGMEGILTVE
jgi:plastocyanin